MPAELTADGLGIACVFSDGRRRAFTVADVAQRLLAADLLVGLAGLVHPHGSVDAPTTVGCYLTGLKDLSGFAHARGQAGGAGTLTRALLAEYWLQAGWLAELTTWRMLTSYDTTTGALAASRAGAGRRPAVQRRAGVDAAGSLPGAGLGTAAHSQPERGRRGVRPASDHAGGGAPRRRPG